MIAHETEAVTIEEDTLDLALSEEDWAEEPEPKLRAPWLALSLALGAIAAWTATFVWTFREPMLAGAPLAQWIAWISLWTMPVLLVAVSWLLATRNSRHEARRFGDVAQLLSAESRLLETRLGTINRELSLAREFLASQSRELDALGRVATERLSTHADHLQSLVHDNGQQVEALATVSSTALTNMNKLRDDLPVIANSARDVSNQIGNAGRVANEHVAELTKGFERLNDFGLASERQVGSLQNRIEEALGRFEEQLDQLDRLTSERFEVLRTRSEAFRAELDGREVETLAALRRRADSLSEELRATHESLASEEEEALVSLRARLGGLREEAKTIGNAVRESEEAALGTWGEQVEAMKQRLTEAIEVITGVDENALASANRKLAALKTEAENVDRGIAERDQRLQDRIAERQAVLAEAEREYTEALASRLAEIDAAIAERREAHIAQTDELARKGETITERLVQLRAEVEAIASHGGETEKVLAQSLERLEAKLTESRSTLNGTDEAVASLTEASVRLLELLQASAQHSREDLPLAIGEAESRLASVEERAGNLKLVLDEANVTSAQLSDYVAGARDTGRETITDVDALHERFAQANEAHTAQIAELRNVIASLDEDSTAVAEKARVDLRDAIEALETAARSARAAIGESASESIRELAERVGTETSQALDEVMREKAEQSIGQLEKAAAKASDASRQAAIQLRDQLAKVDELAGNLETRVAHARQRAEEQVDNDFARRMALITESLNSNAIDIAKALSTDVTDTAWASYLRGDRGIFTRRAVRLLSRSEAREIASLYESEPDFQENVNRYVADFEGMLRTMLSTRDGNALGVTLLSSDMGKLYVALAQAIKRLRE
ncbi:ATPase [Pelagerythrobacter rhizovicinus]|uniref:ATPase n=2 Tax=Pelagerythrobacter rhizovicinus TaxID=2268576 RepID=A0A4V1QWG2_9SPHN|nr:ATPase [Pelagerythrobacter rhizovicinus]